MNQESEAGFLNNDYVNFLVIIVAVGLFAAFVTSGLAVRIVLGALVAGVILLSLLDRVLRGREHLEPRESSAGASEKSEPPEPPVEGPELAG